MTRAIVVDCETTGLNPEKSRVIEIAIVDFVSGEVLLKSYFNPECEITAEITAINHITNEMVKDAPLFAAHAPLIAQLISDSEAFIGQNPFFDKGMIAEEMKRAGVTITWPQLVCTKRIWDVYEPREERHLMNAYKRFVDRAGFEGAHGALPDTLAAREVLLGQIKEFGLRDPDTGVMIPWDQMDPERKHWWGPSAHVLRHPEKGHLVCNFGKNKDKPIVEVDLGFWRWVKDRDFPDHVMMIAIKMIDFGGDARFHAWAEEYAKEKF